MRLLKSLLQVTIKKWLYILAVLIPHTTLATNCPSNEVLSLYFKTTDFNKSSWSEFQNNVVSKPSKKQELKLLYKSTKNENGYTLEIKVRKKCKKII